MQQLQMLDIPNNCSAWCHNSFLHFDVSKGCVELIEEKADDAKVSNVHCLTKARAPYASDFKASGVQCRLDINLQWLGREVIAIQRGALQVSKLGKFVSPFVKSLIRRLAWAMARKTIYIAIILSKFLSQLSQP